MLKDMCSICKVTPGSNKTTAAEGLAPHVTAQKLALINEYFTCDLKVTSLLLMPKQETLRGLSRDCLVPRDTPGDCLVPRTRRAPRS